MKCQKCGREFSSKVWQVHRRRCNAVQQEAKEITQVRQVAIDAIADNHTKDELIERAEIAGVAIDKRWRKQQIAEALNGGTG